MIDTAAKRRSAAGSAAHLSMYPDADGVIDQGDRQQAAVIYRAILAQPFVVTAFRNIIGRQYVAPNIIGRQL